MKKLLAALVALVAINASAYDVTNTVTIVSNIYNRISEEHWITNNIKNTHTNYHYTNNVYTVSNVTLLVSQTNVHTTATYDMGRVMLSRMSNEVDRAHGIIDDAREFSYAASTNAGNASAYASQSRSYAASAQNTLNNVNTRGAEIINRMSAKQTWFDQNYGKMITNHNIYVAEDQVARAGVAQNAADIASLEGRVGDNIQQLTTRMGAAEGNISSLGSRMGTAEGGIASLNGSVSKLVARVGTNEVKIADLNKFAGESSNRFDQVESDIESLESRVGDNIQQLTTRIGTAELNITTLGTRMGAAEGNITTLGTRIGTAEGNITTLGTRISTAEGGIASLNGSVSKLVARVGTNEVKIADLNKFAGESSNRFDQVESDIESLESRVGDNIQQLTTRIGTAELNITTLGTRIGTAEGNITTLGTRISTAEGEISALKPMLGVATNYVISTDDSAVPEAVFELGYKNNPQNVVIGYVKIRRGFNESYDHINYTTGYSYAVAQPNVNLFSSYDNSWWFSPNYEQNRYFNIVLMDQGGYYIDAKWNGYTYNGDPYNFPMTEAGNVTGNWRGTSGRTLYCKMISNTINMRTDLKYIQGTFVYDKDGNKVDELIFKSEVSNDTQRLEAHIRTADANFNDIFARLRVLEASISHKNYIYDFKRSGTQLGTLTVNTDNPTVTADTSEYTEYSYPYTTTWSQSSTTASPSVTSCKKRIYKNGITNPQTMVTFSMSSGVQITMNSTTTYNSIKSYFTDSVQFTTYNPQYTFILSFNKTSD